MIQNWGLAHTMPSWTKFGSRGREKDCKPTSRCMKTEPRFHRGRRDSKTPVTESYMSTYFVEPFQGEGTGVRVYGPVRITQRPHHQPIGREGVDRDSGIIALHKSCKNGATFEVAYRINLQWPCKSRITVGRDPSYEHSLSSLQSLQTASQEVRCSSDA